MTQGKPPPPPPKPCPLERYLHVMSGTWVPRIVWYLRFGARRYGDLKRELNSISSKVLTEKLRALEADGFVVRRVIEASPPQVEYSLSARGRAFEPVYKATMTVAAKLEKLDAEELSRKSRPERRTA